VLAVAVGGAWLALELTAQHGIAIQVDGVKYLSASESLREGRGLVQFDGEPMVLWPPLYPALLAGAGALAEDSTQGARWLHALLYASTVILAAVLFARAGAGPILTPVGAVVVAISPLLVHATLLVQSELAFFVLFLAFLLATASWMDRPTRTRWIAMTIFAALACLQRYSGLALVAMGAVVLLFRPSGRSIPFGIGRSIAFAGLAVAPLAAWAVRNAILTGRPLGERLPPTRTLLTNLSDIGDAVTSWFIPTTSIPDLDARLALGGAVLAAGIALVAARTLLPFEEPPSVRRRIRITLAAAAIVVPGYLAFYLASASISHQARLSHRYLGPVFLPLLAFGLVAVDTAGRGLGRLLHARRVGSVTAVVLLLLWASFVPWGRTDEALGNLRRGGFPSFSAVGWTESPALAWIREHPEAIAEPLYTNSPEAVWLYTRRTAQSILPRTVRPSKYRESAFVDEEGTIVWFAPYRVRVPLPNGGFDEFDRIDAELTAVPIAELADATIFRVRRSAPAESPRSPEAVGGR
jgi:hypothetical protein